jgi:rubredoxin
MGSAYYAKNREKNKDLVFDEATTKTCPKCKINKSYKEFIRNNNQKDALSNVCRECHYIYNTKWKKENKEAHNANHDRWMKTSSAKAWVNDWENKYRKTIEGRIRSWKAAAKQRGFAWEIDIYFLKSLPMTCHYSGVDLTMERKLPNTFSIDRIDSSKGYTKDNVVPCAYIVNIMKNHFEADEFIKYCKLIASNPVLDKSKAR